jgi:L-serine dehydratase
MERLSIFDIYKIGVGPSSSHTLGPWNAASRFAGGLRRKSPDRIEIHLYGSLSKTGVGHATDVAVQLGLEGNDPATMDTATIPENLARILREEHIMINRESVPFFPKRDIVFHNHSLPVHPNTLTFKAYQEEVLLDERTYYSLGGGFLDEEGVDQAQLKETLLPFPIDTGKELLSYVASEDCRISDIVWANELRFRNYKACKGRVNNIFKAMVDGVYRGVTTGGILPGGLNVRRRAQRLNAELLQGATFNSKKKWMKLVEQSPRDFVTINKWISCFALAVNEENAALGRVVTSPTNGAAGVIPAVILYMYFFCDKREKDHIERFLMTSGEIGCIFKKGATISAAMGGCQAEIGVSSAMAAGGLTEVLGGTPKQALMAAEIAMEHHLGLTCDPIGGLVQIPCIERNAMGAIKAITAANLALSGDPDDCKVNFDIVVKTMWDTAQDMNHKYKETSEGGLAFNLPVVLPNC